MLFNRVVGRRGGLPLLDGNRVNIQFLHESRNSARIAAALQELKFLT